MEMGPGWGGVVSGGGDSEVNLYEMEVEVKCGLRVSELGDI